MRSGLAVAQGERAGEVGADLAVHAPLDHALEAHRNGQGLELQGLLGLDEGGLRVDHPREVASEPVPFVLAGAGYGQAADPAFAIRRQCGALHRDVPSLEHRMALVW